LLDKQRIDNGRCDRAVTQHMLLDAGVFTMSE
jgi:hypothetical protein